jgi:hypothetical protein
LIPWPEGHGFYRRLALRGPYVDLIPDALRGPYVDFWGWRGLGRQWLIMSENAAMFEGDFEEGRARG